MTAIIGFGAAFILVPIITRLLRLFGIFTTVEERQCRVYVIFGKVVAILDEPGLHFLPSKIGIKALWINLFGKCHRIDMRLDQQYVRSQPVNSEEGAPMGIGVWYEMFISDPEAFLFKNTDPRGSLSANVRNSTVKCLSNMELERLLESRHEMSRVVREEVSPQSHKWGYKLGSIYIRKVHFRDGQMIDQIEEKVVNRLRQVTSAIQQDGVNQVSLITRSAERQAAVAFAEAAAMRPKIVGQALHEISADPEVFETLFEVLEIQRLLEHDANVTLIPQGARGDLLTALAASTANAPGNQDKPSGASRP